ncbi:hypothetical protein [Roseivivax lentus]|uniref:hypothetical protein n=1 Tax=Roseivivax lentus TaxID=633194 RepID=UPI001F42A8F4|nr:hypothetical protein [Roseivivax lentus]
MVVPAALSEDERDAFARRLYHVHAQVFAGLTAQEFREHVITPPAETTRIQIYETPEGQILGYCGIHRYRRRVRGRDAIVLRAEAGLLPEYRGRGVTYGFGMIRAAVEKLRHPFTPVYYLGTLVHASSYHLFCKYFPRLFPRPDAANPAEMQEVARELIESFSDPPVTPSDPFIRDVGWVTIETPQETRLNARDDRPDVAFFKKRNPGYGLGHGLVVVVPMTFGNLADALRLRAAERLRMKVGHYKPEL